MIRIDKWAGLVTNASPYAIPPGATVEQVNLQCLSPGQLTVRPGFAEMPVASGIQPAGSIVRAVRYEHGSVEQVVFQDSAGRIFCSASAGQEDAATSTPPGRPAFQTVIPGNGTLSLTLSAASGSVSGYSFQTSTDGGVTWTGAGASQTTTFAITGLANGTPYYVRAAAVWSGGVGDYSEAFGPVTPKASSATPATAPPLVTASASSALTATVVWQTPVSDGGSAITGYRVQYSSDGGATWTTALTAPAAAVSTPVGSLTAGTSYVFRVAAVTGVGVGQNSSISNAVVIAAAVSAPGAPQNVSAVATTTTIVLAWQAPASSGSSAILDYTIKYTAGGVQQTVTATGAGFTLTGLTANTSYVISVAARSAAGTGEWVTLPPVTTQATPANTAPSAVTGLSLTRSASGFTATWSAPTSNGGSAVTGYTLSTATAVDGPYTTRYQGTATTATVTGLVAGTLYYVRVIAANAVGNSSPAQGTVTPGQAPSAPLNLAVSFFSSAGSVRARLSWSPPANLYGVPVLYYTATSTQPPPPATPATTQSTQISGNATTAELPAVIGLSYTWSVTAVTAAGESAAATVSLTVTDPDAKPLPSAPLAVVVTPGNSTVTVTWDQPSYAGTSAILSYTVTATGRPSVTIQASAARQHTFTGLANGTSYVVTVAARNLSGLGPAASADPVIPFTLASLPLSLSAANMGSGYWLLRWSRPQSSGGLQILHYGIRSNIGVTGPYAGNAGLIANTSGNPSSTGALSYVYRSSLPGAFASDGSKAGRFDVYAVTSAGEGAIVSTGITLPEATAPATVPLSLRTVVLSATDRGVATGVASFAISSGANLIWDMPRLELQWSYDGVTYVDAPAGAIRSTKVTPNFLNGINNVYEYGFALSIPYSSAQDPTASFKHTIRLRARPILVNRFAAEIPYTPPPYAVASAAVTYSAPDAPTPSSVTDYFLTRNNFQDGSFNYTASLHWSAPQNTGGLPVTQYVLQAQYPSNCAINQSTVPAHTLNTIFAWAPAEGLRWRVGAQNPVGVAYSDWQYQTGDSDVVIGTVTVPGTAAYLNDPVDTGLVPTGAVRLFASGSVNYGTYTAGPAGNGVIDSSSGFAGGALVARFGSNAWTAVGECKNLNAPGAAQKLFLGVSDSTPADNTGSLTVTVVSAGRVMSPPVLPEYFVNGSTVLVRFRSPTNTQGLTVTGYRLQSSLNNSTWTTIKDQASSSPGSQSIVVENQPAGTVYYRVYAMAGTALSNPLLITKRDGLPSAPGGLTSVGQTVSWVAPPFDGGPAITEYKVQVAQVPFSVGSFGESYWRAVPQQPLGLPANTAAIGANTTPTMARFFARVAAVNAVGQGPWAQIQIGG